MTRAVVALSAVLVLGFASSAGAATCAGSLDHACPWDSVATIGDGTLNAPRSAWAGRDGSVLVADSGNQRVLRFDAAGAPAGRADGGADIWADAGAASGADENVVLSPGLVQRLASDGSVRRSWQAPDRGTSYAPGHGVAVAPDGTIYVTNASTQNGGSVVRYSPAGDVLGSFSEHIDRPRSVAVAPDGDVYVASSGLDSKTVDVYSATGEHKRTLGDFCGFIDSVAVDSQGTIFVASYGRIAVLAPDGQVVGAFGQVGAGPAQFGDVTIATAPGDQLLVADRDNNRVLRFHIDRAALQPLGVATCQLFHPHPPIPASTPADQILPPSVKVVHARALVPVNCPAKHHGRCRGSLTIGLPDRHARARFDIAPGRRQTLRIRLRGRAWHLALIQHRFVTLELKMNAAPMAMTWVLLHH